MNRRAWDGGSRAYLARLAVCGALSGCDVAGDARDVEAHAGVFYGGQVQRLAAVDWSSAAPPKIGFRVLFSGSEQRVEHIVRWELTRPGPAGRRVTEIGEDHLPAGRRQFDQVLEFPPSAPLGTINVRVLVDDQLVVDRALVLRSGA